jgi:hypothetical protein
MKSWRDDQQLAAANLIVHRQLLVQTRLRRYMMRLLKGKVKEALFHPEKLVRQEGLHYFCDRFIRDAEVKTLVLDDAAKGYPMR